MRLKIEFGSDLTEKANTRTIYIIVERENLIVHVGNPDD